MLCSLCFKHKNNCILLSCNHHVCLSCLPKQSPSQKNLRYQCETCLVVHEIDLTQKTSNDRNICKDFSRASSQKSQIFNESYCIFCWTCHQAISLNQYIKGRHHDHSVQTYEQAIPSIKTLLLQELQKSLTLKEYLSENKLKLQKNQLQNNYECLLDQINEFFHKQMEIVQRKRQRVIEQVQISYSHCLNQVQKNIKILQPLIQDIQELQTKLSHFITDQIPITQINPIGLILLTVEEYTTNLKDRKFIVNQLPQFISKCTVKETIQNVCSLFVNKLNDSQNNPHQVSIKKANLRDKFFGIDSIKSPKDELKNGSKINLNQQNDPSLNRRVKLVQKIKTKMKYSSSMCSTTLS